MVKIPIVEPLNEVLKRQIPRDMGKPIPMQAYHIDHPKDCGNPWMGAYSKHGLWYKFSKGDSNDFDKVVALSYETDGYCMNYESFDSWKTAFEDNFTFIVAKNLKEDVVGSISWVRYEGTAVIGVYYVTEDYRHSGIGSKLFAEAIGSTDSRNVLFHSYSHLSGKSERFGLCVSTWAFDHYVIDKPTGLPSLKDSGVKLKAIGELTSREESELISYDKGVCGVERSGWLRAWIINNHSDAVVAFSDQGRVRGFGSSRELAGGMVRRILIGPLYADDPATASAIIFALLNKYYNPEEDHEWDPDVHAIYRRSVHVIIPEGKTAMLQVMGKLRGETGKITRQRLTYRTRCRGSLPQASLSKVFAVSDLHLAIV